MLQSNQRSFLRFDRSTGIVTGSYTAAALSVPIQDQALESAAPLPAMSVEEADIHAALGFPAGASDTEGSGIVEIPTDGMIPQFGFWVDPVSLTVSPRVPLLVRADRTQLHGDGVDAIQIEIQTVDDQGRLVPDFQGNLRVTTTSGRLSEPGGRLEAKNGACHITLTSTPETIAKVWVTVTDEGGRYAPGSLAVEFL